MKIAIGAALTALALTAAFPAAANHNTSHVVGVKVAQAQTRAAQTAPRQAEPARPAAAMPGMKPGQAMPGHGTMDMMSAHGMPADMSQMMSSCPCCRQAMQGTPARPS